MQGQRHPRRGVVIANIATLFFGLAGVLGKLSGLPAPLITLGRVCFAGVALGLWALATHIPLRARGRRDVALLAFQGVILAVHWTAFFQAIVVSNVAIGLLAFSSFPLFTAALEPVILRQRPSAPETLAALLILPGIALLTPSLSLGSDITLGVLWGLLAGATFALLSVLNRQMAARYPRANHRKAGQAADKQVWSSPAATAACLFNLSRICSSVMISLYQDGVAALVLAPTVFFVSASRDLTPQAILLLAALGLFCTALAHTLFIASMRDITAQLASVIAALEPVWGVLFAWLALSETPAARTLLGGALIVGAALLPGVVALVRRQSARALADHPT